MNNVSRAAATLQERYWQQFENTVSAGGLIALTRQHSLNAGLAGIAYGLLLRYRMSRDERSLALASQVIECADRKFSDLTEPEECRELRNSNSLFHSHPGIYMTAACIAGEQNDESEVVRAMARYVLCVAERGSDIPDATLGNASALMGIVALLERVAAPEESRVALRVAGASLAERLQGLLDGVGSDENKEVNFAHGWGGILYAAMRFNAVASISQPPIIRRCLDEILASATEHPTFGGLVWPVPPGARGWGESSWCNGATGLVWLWLCAYDVFRDQRYMEAADGAAFYAGQNLRSRNASICCGLAGQAYALFAIARYTGDEAWGRRATDVAAFMATRVSERDWETDGVHGLFRGLNGASLLLEGIDKTGAPALPVFEG